MYINYNGNHLAFYKDCCIVKEYYKYVRVIYLNKAITYEKLYRERNKQNLNFTLIIKCKCTVAD